VAHTCPKTSNPKLVVVTGGPGAGKTAVLEVIQRELCEHVIVLPEAASILWRGGFPRRDTFAARCAAQRTIARVQIELQRMTIEDNNASLILCDRGTLDGLAYWPGKPSAYYEELGIVREQELARYAAVIQLRPPPLEHGYQQTTLRPEDATVASEIDARIEAAWAGHPRHVIIASDANFLSKLERAVAAIHAALPPCCAERRTAGLARIQAQYATTA
jgi:predicted ATPase